MYCCLAFQPVLCGISKHAKLQGLKSTTPLCTQAPAGMPRSLAKPGVKKPRAVVKPMLAAFGAGDSDDDS